MEALPSYEEATTAPHWLQLAAPYVPAIDWRRCSLVNNDFYSQFAPLLWLDPLVTARTYGLHPNDDLAWYREFVYVHLRSVRTATRSLVQALDFRDFAVVASGLYSTDASERAISESFRDFPTLFPRLTCLLVDGHPEINPESLSLIRNRDEHQDTLELLDLAGCQYQLIARFFGSSYLRNLVYLDISCLPGSVSNAIQTSLNPQHLPHLRVLKIRGRELDDSAACYLFEVFGRQLWSLDLSDNRLTNAIIDKLIEKSFSPLSLRSNAHFGTEGKLMNPHNNGTISYGRFEFILESNDSANFSGTYQYRYMPDAPPYDHQEWRVARLIGTEPKIDDSANVIGGCLLHGASGVPLPPMRGPIHDIRAGRGGLTHLHLNGNQLTSMGIEKLLRCALGWLQHFECDVPGATLSTVTSKTGISVHGLFRLSPLLRPVFSSNLKSIRLHHSVVTQIPHVHADWLQSDEALVIAETIFRDRVRMAYPESFTPNMNPRIMSLTLTGIPTRSSGPLISTITRFLDLASAQQKDRENVVATQTMKHGSTTLQGLRHIRLELAREDCDDLPSMLPDSKLDFSIPRLGQYKTSQGGNGHSVHYYQSSSCPTPYSDLGKCDVRRTPSNEFQWHDSKQEYITHRVEAWESSTGNLFTISVWVGTGLAGPYPAINEYMANLQDPGLRKNPGPAMPNHISAGVPAGSFIYLAAWDAMITPTSIPDVAIGSVVLEDVATAIKRYRAGTKGTANHWTGRLELVRT